MVSTFSWGSIIFMTLYKAFKFLECDTTALHNPAQNLIQQISLAFECFVACTVHVPGYESKGNPTIWNTKFQTQEKSAVKL